MPNNLYDLMVEGVYTIFYTDKGTYGEIPLSHIKFLGFKPTSPDSRIDGDKVYLCRDDTNRYIEMYEAHFNCYIGVKGVTDYNLDLTTLPKVKIKHTAKAKDFKSEYKSIPTFVAKSIGRYLYCLRYLDSNPKLLPSIAEIVEHHKQFFMKAGE